MSRLSDNLGFSLFALGAYSEWQSDDCQPDGLIYDNLLELSFTFIRDGE